MLSFPADHYSHPNFQTEWWYYTGHLTPESGRLYGYQVTFFRFGVRDRQNGLEEKPLFTDLFMAHFALSDTVAGKFSFRERINRGSGDRAGAATDRYLVWNEDWKVEGGETDHRITVNDRGTTLQLTLRSTKPPVLHGDKGHSQKGEGEGRASYYYSLTRMAADRADWEGAPAMPGPFRIPGARGQGVPGDPVRGGSPFFQPPYPRPSA